MTTGEILGAIVQGAGTTEQGKVRVKKTEIEKELAALSERSDRHHKKILSDIREKYRDTLRQMSAEALSEKTGISKAAFDDIHSLSYSPAHKYTDSLRIGEIKPKDNLSVLNTETIPYFHDFLKYRNLIIKDFDSEPAHNMIQNLAFRVLSSIDPQLVIFNFFDPTGLGQHFSYFTELSDAIKGAKILTEPAEIERALAEAKAAAVNLVQEKLTHKYNSLQDYNADAGSKLAEPYRFIFISNFPAGFTQRAIETLLSIINTSSKSGISVILNIDHEELGKHRDLDKIIFTDTPLSVLTPKKIVNVPSQKFLNKNFHLIPDNQITSRAHEIIRAANKQALLLQNRTIDVEEFYSSSPYIYKSDKGIHIPIGLVGKDKPCLLTLGEEKSGHHVLIGGATGSGKTVLLHNIIVNGAWQYSPEELIFYLLDYKEGTEFKLYDNLPHVHILSMESNRPFGLSALQYLQQEIERRGKLFKKQGVAKIQDYRSKKGEKLPRILVIIDEFQVLLKGHDRLSAQGAEMLDDISRRGRSFGVHMLLSTQTLSEVNLKNSTLSNIAIRIGLRMSDTDSAKLFHRENTTAATLKKPGEAYYNAAHGQSESNLRFQVAYLDTGKIEERIDRLEKSDAGENIQHRYIFDGQHYLPLQKHRIEDFIKLNSSKSKRLYADLGIAEPGYISQKLVSLRLRRQFSSNVLMIGDSPQDVIGLSLLMLYQLVMQSTNNSRFYIADMFAVDTPWYGKIEILKKIFPEQIIVIGNKKLDEVLAEFNSRLDESIESDEASQDRMVLFLLNIQAARTFNSKEAMGGSAATKIIEKLLKEGAEFGIHIFLHSLYYQGLEKVFTNRNMLDEFENRIILRGGNSEKLLPDNSQVIKHEGLAYLISPQASYGADPARLYEPEDILEYFHTMKKSSL